MWHPSWTPPQHQGALPGPPPGACGPSPHPGTHYGPSGPLVMGPQTAPMSNALPHGGLPGTTNQPCIGQFGPSGQCGPTQVCQPGPMGTPLNSQHGPLVPFGPSQGNQQVPPMMMQPVQQGLPQFGQGSNQYSISMGSSSPRPRTINLVEYYTMPISSQSTFYPTTTTNRLSTKSYVDNNLWPSLPSSIPSNPPKPDHYLSIQPS